MIRLATAAILALCLLSSHPARGQAPPSYAEARDYARWEKEVAAYEAADVKSPPPKGGILFIGSSTIRLWKTLAEDYPDLKVINRGFGGTEIVDSTHFADRLIFPHEPRQIFLRAGGNDIHAGRTPKEVAHDFSEFVRVVHARLPKTEILYIGVSPAPARWGESDKSLSGNRLDNPFRRDSVVPLSVKAVPRDSYRCQFLVRGFDPLLVSTRVKLRFDLQSCLGRRVTDQ